MVPLSRLGVRGIFDVFWFRFYFVIDSLCAFVWLDVSYRLGLIWSWLEFAAGSNSLTFDLICSTVDLIYLLVRFVFVHSRSLVGGTGLVGDTRSLIRGTGLSGGRRSVGMWSLVLGRWPLVPASCISGHRCLSFFVFVYGPDSPGRR